MQSAFLLPCRLYLSALSNSFMVRFMSTYATSAVAGFGVAQHLKTASMQVILGISTGVLPLIAYSYAAGAAKEAFILSLMEKGIIDIPLMFVMDQVFPLYGLMLILELTERDSSAFEDILSFLSRHPDLKKWELRDEPILSLSELESGVES